MEYTIQQLDELIQQAKEQQNVRSVQHLSSIQHRMQEQQQEIKEPEVKEH